MQVTTADGTKAGVMVIREDTTTAGAIITIDGIMPIREVGVIETDGMIAVIAVIDIAGVQTGVGTGNNSLVRAG